jgi:hypothetical protein
MKRLRMFMVAVLVAGLLPTLLITASPALADVGSCDPDVWICADYTTGSSDWGNWDDAYNNYGDWVDHQASSSQNYGEYGD